MPNAPPSKILKKPAIKIIELPNFSDLYENANGNANTKVINAIDTIVPIEKQSKNITPVINESDVGNIASNTAALPAKPCTKPIK